MTKICKCGEEMQEIRPGSDNVFAQWCPNCGRLLSRYRCLTASASHQASTTDLLTGWWNEPAVCRVSQPATRELEALREGIDKALNIEGYDDADRIHEVAEIFRRWIETPREAQVRQRREKEQDLEVYGNYFEYKGERLNPTKVTIVRKESGKPDFVEVEVHIIRDTLNRLLEWAESTGGWEASVWEDVKSLRDQLNIGSMSRMRKWEEKFKKALLEVRKNHNIYPSQEPPEVTFTTDLKRVLMILGSRLVEQHRYFSALKKGQDDGRRAEANGDTSAIVALTAFLNHSPEAREVLEELGFAWSMPS